MSDPFPGERIHDRLFEGIKVHGARAEATASWPAQNGNGNRIEHRLALRKVAGIWRVTEDRGPMF